MENKNGEDLNKAAVPPLPVQHKIIKSSELQAGDILLHRSIRQKLHQKTISKQTGSPYTHASIYLGDGNIAEATPPGVRIAQLSEVMKEDFCIGVLRSQLGFSADRAEKLRDFINEFVCQQAKYDLSGVITFSGRNKAFFENQMNIIKDHYGKFLTKDDLTNKKYFCSALVVACYYVVGIIGETAQVAYPHDVLSPADLYSDPTFGWFLGYLIRAGQQVPAGDPLALITSWGEIID